MGEVPPAPSTPGRLALWALAWAAVAVAGFVVLSATGVNLFGGALEGQRSAGIVVFTPLIATAVALLLVVRSVLSVGKTRAYRAAYSEEVRRKAQHERNARQHPGFFWVVAAITGTLWLAGATAVLIFLPNMLENPTGLALAIMLLGLLAMAWIPALAAAITATRARRATP